MDNKIPAGYSFSKTAIVYYIDDFKREVKWRGWGIKEEFDADPVMVNLTLPAAQDPAKILFWGGGGYGGSGWNLFKVSDINTSACEASKIRALQVL